MLNQQTLLVLSGGFGTRLKSVVSEVPKPLAPVNGRPFLYYQIKNWTHQGLTNFIFLLYNQSELIIEFLTNEKDGILKGCDVKWVVEPEPMGTGGAVAYSVNHLNIEGDFLVTNADTWLGSGINEIIASEAPAMAVIKVEDSGRYGSVKLSNDQIVSFEEKSDRTDASWINAGLCKLNTQNFKTINEKVFSLEQSIFPLLAKQGDLTAVQLDAEFIDIGIPEDYFRFIKLTNS
jgi:D-glycero-alpha-D-manno-heptose 1-phosphate guanylyltransferase